MDEEKKVNPVKRRFEWKSSLGKFEYYDKDFEQKVSVNPEEFIIIDTKSSIGGWHEDTKSGIYSNKINLVGKEEFVVKSFKGGELHRGIYSKDTKHLFEKVGGVFYKVYTVIENGELNEYWVKGSAMFQVGEDIKGVNTKNNKVKFVNEEKRKKGSVIYSVPRFAIGSEITASDKVEIGLKTKLLDEYNNSFVKKEVTNSSSNDDLPF